MELKINENFNEISLNEMEDINGGIAPLIIAGIKLATVTGVTSFVAGYTYRKVSNWLS